MSGHILDTGCTVACPHGGQATITSANTKVKVGGKPAVLATDTMLISKCSFTLPSGTPSPCVTVQWSAPAGRVTVNGTAVLLSSSQGVCKSAAGAPQGPAQVSGMQQATSGA
jgi:hypothetical protein